MEIVVFQVCLVYIYIWLIMIIYAGNLAPFLMHLRIILLWSFMLIAGWMRETHHLKYSYESAIIWLWNIETWKKRTVAYKNETQLMNPQFDAIGPPVITCDPKTWLWHAIGRPAFECFAGSQPWWLFRKGRSQWVTRVISTSGDSHMSHLHFWFTCSCLHFCTGCGAKASFPATGLLTVLETALREKTKDMIKIYQN
jgi:hypothetical protein